MTCCAQAYSKGDSCETFVDVLSLKLLKSSCYEIVCQLSLWLLSGSVPCFPL